MPTGRVRAAGGVGDECPDPKGGVGLGGDDMTLGENGDGGNISSTDFLDQRDRRHGGRVDTDFYHAFIVTQCRSQKLLFIQVSRFGVKGG